MAFKKIFGYIQLARPVNAAITLIAIAAACRLSGARMEQMADIVLAAVTGALVAAGGNAINDYFDIEIDRINKPERPLPAGVLSAGEAKGMWLLTSASALGLNVFLNPAAFIIVCFAVAALYFYSSYFKRTVLMGNILVAAMTGMAFLYGGAAAGSIQRAVLPAVFAFLSNFGREVVKDVEDVKGDEAKGAKTFPVRYGVVLALRIAALTMILLVLSTAEAIRQNIYNAYFTLTVLPLDVVFLIIAGVLCSSVSDRVLHRISALLKIGMLIGIIGIIAGSL